MEHAKNCKVKKLSKNTFKKLNNGNIVIAEELRGTLTLDKLKDMFDDANKHFIDYKGKEHKWQPAACNYVLIKKINNQNVLLGVTKLKRVAGNPADISGLNAMFTYSPDSYVLEERIIAPGYETEDVFFNERVLSTLKYWVSYGCIKEAEYGDTLIYIEDRAELIKGVWLSRIAFFFFVTICIGLLCHSWTIGLSTGFIFTTSMFVSSTKSITMDRTEAPEA